MSVQDMLLNESDELSSQRMEVLKLLSSRCTWLILAILKERKSGMINITALVNKLNSNYRTVNKCIEHMKKLGLVEDYKIGRLRLIKVNENSELLKRMFELLEISALPKEGR
ncbi:MAG TPA: hypothetical protein EYH02_00735 [Ignisphaera aggregans]|uniref:ArsR family transcriptional regulator n=1 Tax=Ignisphaera aggregans TaxID=334771 RepID=A0A832YYG6_9CREN|nr:hypothetical protein [Ignisphaera aggregans]